MASRLQERYARVSAVLIQVFFLNLLVAVSKIALGYATGAVSILSDGFHSLTDTASNVVALVGVRIASQPPDEDHPYGHRKFETMASVGILIFLILVLLQVVNAAVERFRTGGAPIVEALSFAVMGGTFLINLFVVIYERKAGRRLQSEVLLADAHHTTSDLGTSAAVILALVGVKMGYAILNPIAAIGVAVFIGKACWEIFMDTAQNPRGPRGDSRGGDSRGRAGRLRGDRLPPHPHARRRRPRLPGPARLAERRLRLDEAHRISHVVKDHLMERFPQIKDAVIHIEPPPQDT